ncbi:MAG: hypothetical protein MK101_00520 [Phycisphaerales bacterium]|nr:hypothetical protein [Phycisphaerales bacterium]
MRPSAHLLTLAMLTLPACTPRTIEYRRVPAWAQNLGATATSHVDEDGNEVRWVVERNAGEFVASGSIGSDGTYVAGEPPPPPRLETADGPVLHCLLPMHVVANLRQCMTDEEYDVIWEQLLSDSQRAYYEEGGEVGRAAFERFLRQARKDLVTCLRRMEAGDVFGDVKQWMIDSDRMGIRLHKRVRGDFPVYGIVITQARDGSLRLHDILYH